MNNKKIDFLILLIIFILGLIFKLNIFIMIFFTLICKIIYKYYNIYKRKKKIKELMNDFFKQYSILSFKCLKEEKLSIFLQDFIKSNANNALNIQDPYELIDLFSKGIRTIVKEVSIEKYNLEIVKLDDLRNKLRKELQSFEYFDDLKIRLF